MDAILNMKSVVLLCSTERDYSNCNNFMSNLTLTKILRNIHKILSNDKYVTQVTVNGSNIAFYTQINDNNILCTICIYKSTSTNGYLITIKISEKIINFGHFYNHLKKSINAY